MKKFVWLFLVLLLPACATTSNNIYYEDLLSVGTSKTVTVEQYEAIAFNLRKIHDGIAYLCKDDRQGCAEIRVVYAKTRVAFINKGNTLIELLKTKEGTPEHRVLSSKYIEDTKQFDVLYGELKRRATELGIGGINK